MDWFWSFTLYLKGYWWPLGFVALILFLIASIVLAGRLNKSCVKKTVVIDLTDAARHEIDQRLKEFAKTHDLDTAYFRISCVEGNCSDEPYRLHIERTKLNDDIEINVRGLRVLISEKDRQVLDGISIDFIELNEGGITTSGFRINNSQPRTRCHCTSAH